MSAEISRDEIRGLVRELLRDSLANEGADQGTEAPAASEVGGLSDRVRAALTGGTAIDIAIASDSDLNGFAKQVALCALERDLLGAIASNRVRFRLAGGGGPSPATAPPAAAPAASATPAPAIPAAPSGDGDAYHWEQGLLNETKITEIARSHAKLLLGRRALLTPLAWDRARSLGLQVARTKS